MSSLSPSAVIILIGALACSFSIPTPAAGAGGTGPAACVGGFAAGHPCSEVDLAAHLPLSAIGGGGGNDIWGWTDPVTGREYALMGRTTGTAFVDVTVPENPVYLGDLPTHTNESTWRDIKTHADHAFIVSEADGHGMQVFDLSALRTVVNPPVGFVATAHYDGFGNAHNVAINTDTGFAYAVGTNTCNAGLHMVDISTPSAPSFAGCFSDDGYTHDAQCVVYAGPDPDHAGSEICLNSNEDTLTIVDVTTKSAPLQISRTGYSDSGYTHQGWLTEDHRYYLMDDEFDEVFAGHNTRTRIWDVADLDNPVLIGWYDGPTPAIDHNLYTHMGYAFEANYTAGLRIVDLADVANATLVEVAYFDIHPGTDSPGFDGAWSTYPYFASGTVIVSGMSEGLYVLRPTNLVREQPFFADSFESGDTSGWAPPSR
jgi:choice-of-anchor B domain-containing protein